MSYRTFSHNTTALIAAGGLSALLFVLFSLFSTPALLYAEDAASSSSEAAVAATEEAAPTDHVDTATAEDDASTSSNTESSTDATTNGTSGESTEDTTDATGADDSGTSDITATSSEGTAHVATGDAGSVLDAGTEANTNETSTATPGGTAASTTNNNEAHATTTGEVASATGSNEAAAPQGASVDTGSAWSVANVVNVINTNIFNSEGLLYFLNVLLGNLSLDLRNAFSIMTGDAPAPDSPCSLDGCAASDTTVAVSNQNAATVDNTLSVRATTGNNTASAEDGDATITTGDAYASANVVNVVNTNFTDSNYLLLSVNNFGAFGGDIVFPGADWFYNLFSSSIPAQNTAVTNTNTATVTTEGDIVADTGSNTASGTSATIATGNAHAAATVVNQVNTNILGDSLLFLFRIHGTWAGDVFGLPDGMAWREGPNGVELMFDPSGASAPAGSTDRLEVVNENVATVNNNVSVFALTGENRTSSNGGSSIATGDAYASANVVNVVNTNVLGRNWVLAIFNIFGDWSGNISFGQPDLWVGARALVPADLRVGDCFDYEITVNNLGDAAATDVWLTGFFNDAEQKMSGLGEIGNNRGKVEVGRIPSHGSRLVKLNSCISSAVVRGSSVSAAFSVSSRETDANGANNVDQISVDTVRGASGSALRLDQSELTVTKKANTAVTTASSSIDYTVVIKNSGGPVYNALLVDTIFNPDGKAMHEQRWGLGTIKRNETITVGYTTTFSASTTPGTYRNDAFVFGVDRHPDIDSNLGNEVTSPIASAEVLVRGEEFDDEELEIGEVAGASTDTCTPLISTYIKKGANNDAADVRDLQMFLKMNEGHVLLNETGDYDELTEQAVKAFQEKYAADILDPWGVRKASGYVYYTTQKKVNELWCGDAYPLSPEQQAEINTFKGHADSSPVPLPTNELETIGMTPQTSTDDSVIQEVADKKEEDGNEAMENVAAAAQTIGNDGAWNSLRERLSNMFSWMR